MSSTVVPQLLLPVGLSPLPSCSQHYPSLWYPHPTWNHSLTPNTVHEPLQHIKVPSRFKQVTPNFRHEVRHWVWGHRELRHHRFTSSSSRSFPLRRPHYSSNLLLASTPKTPADSSKITSSVFQVVASKPVWTGVFKLCTIDAHTVKT
ncbi:hypothetical protein C8J57DRAFT_1473704 [Mycena rebaudengoi]|nr:hypothetical protein C8J57DRAFT_1473704 [Mycena rebaudengoi]